jgi:hypothetical protein
MRNELMSWLGIFPAESLESGEWRGKRMGGAEPVSNGFGGFLTGEFIRREQGAGRGRGHEQREEE